MLNEILASPILVEQLPASNKVILAAEASIWAVQGIPLTDLIKSPIFCEYVKDNEMLQGDYFDLLVGFFLSSM